MLSARFGNNFHLLPPMAGATGRFPDSENSIDPINHLNTHKSAIAIFVDVLISNISFHLDASSQRHPCHLGGRKHHRTTKNFSNDYIVRVIHLCCIAPPKLTRRLPVESIQHGGRLGTTKTPTNTS
jgi:hypothetical protein